MTGELKTLISVGVATLVIIFGGIFLLTKSTPPNTPQKVNEALLVREDSNKIATDSAKITLVEFGDFQCPACADAYPGVKQILENNKGLINFVFRNFPLQSHKFGQISAEAAEAAGEQGKYWEMYGKLYEDQVSWANSSNPMDNFISYAKEMGLDENKFKSSIEEGKFKAKIAQDVADGNVVGVRATPTFFVNGEMVVGITNLVNKVNLELQKK